MIFPFITLVTLDLFNLHVGKKFVDRPVSQTSARGHASPPGTPPLGSGAATPRAASRSGPPPWGVS